MKVSGIRCQVSGIETRVCGSDTCDLTPDTGEGGR